MRPRKKTNSTCISIYPKYAYTHTAHNKLILVKNDGKLWVTTSILEPRSSARTFSADGKEDSGNIHILQLKNTTCEYAMWLET